MKQKYVIGDDRPALCRTIQEAMQRADLVITIGGLGPTFDDITREAFAESVDAELEYHSSIFREMKKILRKRDMEPTGNNRRQAYVPAGAEFVLNPVGTAPGIYFISDIATVLLLPGPPAELKGVFKRMEKKVFNQLDIQPIHTRKFKMLAIPESHAEEALADLELPDNAEWSILASIGQVEAHLRVATQNSETAEEVFTDFENQLRELIGQRYYGTDGDCIASVVGNLLKDNDDTIAVAESCTGGWLGQQLTDIPGSSNYMLGGIISYSNQAKEEFLGVEADTLEKQGAVSSEVAVAMASGVRQRFGSDYGLGITGIAGPDGGTDEKPVGTVFIGISSEHGDDWLRFYFRGNREDVRLQSVLCALDMVRIAYLGEAYESAYTVDN